jgi:two-component system OmpR family response regulator/two-component system response regulator QseB
MPTPIDCAVIDLSEHDGELRRMFARMSRGLAPSVLIITALADSATRIEAAHMGIIDGVVAPYDPAEVIARVEIMLARRRRAKREVVHAGDMLIRPADRRVERNGEEVALTPREFDVLLALVSARGRAVSKQELLRDVWHDERRNENAVEAHVSGLRRKVEANGPQVIHTVHRAGYAFRPSAVSGVATRDALLAERARLLRERDEAFARRDELLAELRKRLQPPRR